MGSCTPEPSGHLGKPTPGSKGRNPTYRNQNPTTHNATSASGTTCMEKSHPADQHQCPVGPLTTSIGKPATTKPGTEVPLTETPAGTYDAGNEVAIGATQTPHIPKATSTRARGRTRRKSPLDTAGIIRRTSFGSAIRTTSTACQAPPLSFTT